MSSHPLLRPLVLAAAFLPLASATAAAQEPKGQSMGGPVVAGVCLLSREAVFTHAAVGKDATAQLQKLLADAQAEADRGQARLDAELERLGLRKPGLQVDQLSATQKKALQDAQAAQLQAAQRSRSIEANRAKAIEQISTMAQPIITQVYTRRGCGLLLDRSAVLAGNMSNDITADVVAALDASQKSIKLQP